MATWADAPRPGGCFEFGDGESLHTDTCSASSGKLPPHRRGVPPASPSFPTTGVTPHSIGPASRSSRRPGSRSRLGRVS